MSSIAANAIRPGTLLSEMTIESITKQAEAVGGTGTSQNLSGGEQVF